ncbi:hypothetical protein Tdes44962_MAKER05684 [Teratosphaeria destructans]|uniref:Uncharacterized protein n=1 Tax=Teratosphaeria destructans TaxID=418781 RepID=A0A9W7VYQ4_9PEZI|nr:hypothetical protein Tdes44962_MAKER05684 [Teratosphaeria destructans]
MPGLGLLSGEIRTFPPVAGPLDAESVFDGTELPAVLTPLDDFPPGLEAGEILTLPGGSVFAACPAVPFAAVAEEAGVFDETVLPATLPGAFETCASGLGAARLAAVGAGRAFCVPGVDEGRDFFDAPGAGNAFFSAGFTAVFFCCGLTGPSAAKAFRTPSP